MAPNMRLRRVLPALLGIGALAMPAPAAAHAVLEGTVPERGAALTDPPDSVEVEFNEPVEASFGAIRVFGPDGEPVATGEPTRPGGRAEALSVMLPGDLSDGTYTATFRVVSADSHPVSGGFVFTVGTPGSAGPGVSELLAGAEAGPATDVAFWAARWAGYLAIGLGAGIAIFAVAVWAPAARRLRASGLALTAAEPALRSRALSWLWWCTGVGLAAAAAAIVLQGATAAGISAWDALDTGVLEDVLATRFGEITALRAAGWAVVAAGLLLLGRRRTVGAAAIASGLAVGIVSSALAGHASTHEPELLLVPADAAHVLAMCAWLGGLAALGVLMPAATKQLAAADKTRLLAGVVARFSPLALACVAVLTATGVVASVVYLTRVSDLWESAFGRSLALKAILLALIVALAWLNRRRHLPALVALAREGEGPGRPGSTLRAAVRGEIALIVAVLGVTAALVSYAPPATPQGPVSGTVEIGPATVDFTVEPAEAGANEIHLYLFDSADGSQLDARGVELELELPEREIGPLEAELQRAGPGHFVAEAAPLGVAGEWTARVSYRLSRFEDARGTFEVQIR